MLVRTIVDHGLAQYAYLIGCQQTGEAIVVDPERDVDRYLAAAEAEGLRLVAVAETHIHADFLSGARELASRLPGLRVYLSDEGGDDWKYEWPVRDGLDVTWLHDGDTFRVGNLELRAWHTPGHTPEHLSFLLTDRGGGADAPMAVLSGDFVFVGDLGRPDLLETAAGVRGAMEPAARRLYASAQRFLELPDYIQIWPGHGAGSACGKALGAVPTSTVGYERRFSAALAAGAGGEAPFVRFILAGQPEPPAYFARMKRLNKSGPPLIGRIPRPPRIEAAGVRALAPRRDVQVIDTRLDRQAFLRAHLPGALLAPLDRTFPTVVGSLADPELPLVLIVEEARVDDAVRQLVRIGYDRIDGWAEPAVLDALRADRTTLEAIESIGFDEMEQRLARGGVTVLDVRSAGEHAAGHVPGAVNVAHTRLRADPVPLPDDRPILVHCASGARSAAAAAYLAREGRQAVHVDGSFADWRARAASAAGARAKQVAH